jgi:hypothetical protein
LRCKVSCDLPLFHFTPLLMTSHCRRHLLGLRG